MKKIIFFNNIRMYIKKIEIIEYKIIKIFVFLIHFYSDTKAFKTIFTATAKKF